MNKLQIETDCGARDCGFGESAGDLGCTDGGSCFEAMMLRAKESTFHDATLVDATRKINEILAAIPKDPRGRQLSFLHTRLGTMLAWVRHDMKVPDDAVKAHSSHAAVTKALGLIDPPARDEK